MKNRIHHVMIRGAAILAAGCAYCVWFSLSGFGIPCVFHLITGLKCPGCGVSRMLISLSRLDFRKAFEFNAVLLCMMPLLLALAAVSLVRYIRTGAKQTTRFESGIIWVLVGILLIWGVIRNLPWVFFG